MGLWLSAARCTLAYVVAPVVGFTGGFFGIMGVLLQIIGASTAAYGALRLHRARHRWWGLYASVAAALILLALFTATGSARS